MTLSREFCAYLNTAFDVDLEAPYFYAIVSAVVWAQSNLVGCGFSRCNDVWGLLGRGHRNIFVCHYNPQGNTVFVNGNGQLYAVPAFSWATDSKPRCSECPSDAPACYEGLCYRPSKVEAITETTQQPETNENAHVTVKTENLAR